MSGGFGNHKFGNSPFGRGDFTEDVMVANFPKEYYGDENNIEDEVVYHYLSASREMLDQKYSEIDNMKTMMSPLDMVSGMIPYLADTIGVGINDYEPESFKRSMVNNAVSYYKIKGTNESFRIRGLMSGYEVELQQMWLVDPIYIPMIPMENLKHIGDQYYSDLGPTEVSGVSGSIPYWGECGFCLTAYFGLVATLKREVPQGYTVFVLDRMLESVKSIMPIHVRELFLESRLVFKDIDMSIQTINQGGEETSYRNVGFNFWFDLWPADVIATDVGINVNGYT